MENKRKRIAAVAVGMLLMMAFLIQFTKYLPWPAELLTALWTLRNSIHLSLMFMWCVSLGRRIVSKPVRHMMIAVGCLLAFWLMVRTCKWEYISTPKDLLGRYCWYGYYVPMILVPLLGVFIVDHIGKPESYHCPRWMMLLYIPAGLIVLGVFTNDLHRLVFTFPQGTENYNSIYGYGVLYFIAVAWFVVLGFYFVLMLLKKNRVPGSRRVQKLPVAIMSGAVVFWMVYSLGLQNCDMTAINCLIITLLLEVAIQSGLIPASSHYYDLFRISTCPMQIVDENGQVCYSSDTAEFPAAENILSARGAAVHNGDIVLYSKPISGGYVLWADDVRQVNEVTEKLNGYRLELNQNNQLLKAELELKENRAKTEEMTRLYDRITGDVSPRLEKIDALLERSKDEPCSCRALLAQLCVISAYIKRRGNLILLSNQSPNVSLRELEYCLRESLDNLRLSGIFTSMTANVKTDAPITDICDAYDLFETVIEGLLGHITAVMVYLSDRGGVLRLRLQIGCDGPVSPEELPCLERFFVEVEDEDITLELVLPGGGGNV